MPNGPHRAEFWRSFVLQRCAYPAPGRLHAQFEAAEVHSFCGCGCNSFDVRIPSVADVPPLTTPGGSGGMFFEANFTTATGASVEILLFADGSGNLSSVEVDLNGNSEPVPDEIAVVGPVHHGHVAAVLLPD